MYMNTHKHANAHAHTRTQTLTPTNIIKEARKQIDRSIDQISSSPALSVSLSDHTSLCSTHTCDCTQTHPHNHRSYSRISQSQVVLKNRYSQSQVVLKDRYSQSQVVLKDRCWPSKHRRWLPRSIHAILLPRQPHRDPEKRKKSKEHM